MPLLRMRDASFANATARAGPLTLDLEPGGRIALTFLTSQAATIVALMAAGIAKATTGSVLIGDYDPRVQSVHCKRLAGFVPHEPLQLDERRLSPLHRLSSGAVEYRRDRGAGRRAAPLRASRRHARSLFLSVDRRVWSHRRS